MNFGIYRRESCTELRVDNHFDRTRVTSSRTSFTRTARLQNKFEVEESYFILATCELQTVATVDRGLPTFPSFPPRAKSTTIVKRASPSLEKLDKSTRSGTSRALIKSNRNESRRSRVERSSNLWTLDFH